MSGIVDPSTPEREAREALRRFATQGCNDGPDCIGCKVANQRIDAYAAAVRARALADVAGWVEGMDGYPVRTEADEFYGRDGIETVDRDALLAKLREAK